MIRTAWRAVLRFIDRWTQPYTPRAVHRAELDRLRGECATIRDRALRDREWLHAAERKLLAAEREIDVAGEKIAELLGQVGDLRADRAELYGQLADARLRLRVATEDDRLLPAIAAPVALVLRPDDDFSGSVMSVGEWQDQLDRELEFNAEYAALCNKALPNAETVWG